MHCEVGLGSAASMDQTTASHMTEYTAHHHCVKEAKFGSRNRSFAGSAANEDGCADGREAGQRGATATTMVQRYQGDVDVEPALHRLCNDLCDE